MDFCSTECTNYSFGKLFDLIWIVSYTFLLQKCKFTESARYNRSEVLTVVMWKISDFLLDTVPLDK